MAVVVNLKFVPVHSSLAGRGVGVLAAVLRNLSTTG
jgi:hypothetical protein